RELPSSRYFPVSPVRPTSCETLSLHDALPIFVADVDGLRRLRLARANWPRRTRRSVSSPPEKSQSHRRAQSHRIRPLGHRSTPRSEEHTSELQSPDHLVCRLLLEKKKCTTTQT